VLLSVRARLALSMQTSAYSVNCLALSNLIKVGAIRLANTVLLIYS